MCVYNTIINCVFAIITGTAPIPSWPEPPPHPCTDKLEQFCDFHPDCQGKEDECPYAYRGSVWCLCGCVGVCFGVCWCVCVCICTKCQGHCEKWSTVAEVYICLFLDCK